MKNASPAIRKRALLLLALAATIALGLASRRWPGLFPVVFGKYPGDALWAQMIYWLAALVAPGASVGQLAASALAISYLDELSQLYHAPWIDQIRATTAGHLVLGSYFSWHDMVAYTIGIAIVAPLEWLVLWWRR